MAVISFPGDLLVAGVTDSQTHRQERSPFALPSMFGVLTHCITFAGSR